MSKHVDAANFGNADIQQHFESLHAFWAKKKKERKKEKKEQSAHTAFFPWYTIRDATFHFKSEFIRWALMEK